MHRYIYYYCVLNSTKNRFGRRCRQCVHCFGGCERWIEDCAGCELNTTSFWNMMTHYKCTLAQFRFLNFVIIFLCLFCCYCHSLPFYFGLCYYHNEDVLREIAYVVSVEMLPLNWYMAWICVLGAVQSANVCVQVKKALAWAIFLLSKECKTVNKQVTRILRILRINN